MVCLITTLPCLRLELWCHVPELIRTKAWCPWPGTLWSSVKSTTTCLCVNLVATFIGLNYQCGPANVFLAKSITPSLPLPLSPLPLSLLFQFPPSGQKTRCVSGQSGQPRNSRSPHSISRVFEVSQASSSALSPSQSWTPGRQPSTVAPSTISSRPSNLSALVSPLTTTCLSSSNS